MNRLAHAAAVLLVLVSALSPALHVEADDQFCAPLARDGHGAPTLASAPDSTGQHCEICHWLRSLRTIGPADAGFTTGVDASATPCPTDLDAGDPPTLAARSPRAPPLA